MKEKIVNWLKEYSNNNGLKTFVVGVSGGIDSALTSTLCAETGLETIVVSMPIHQDKMQLARAHKHMNWLACKYTNIQYSEFNLSHVYDSFAMLFADNQCELALANSRARLRMTALYQIAQTNNGLVVGTGNKVEDFGVGFFTKYGDGGVDISPIGNLMKSEVRSLAKEVGVCEEIITAEPTDGLWSDNRTDEDQIGATYEELEWAMTIEEFENLYNLTKLTDRQKEVMAIYKKLHKQNKHKMIPIPVCKIK
tara:strand:- start:4894 stop:5649 length:756 start_codon:yes stop_codon:yes gene_type:complete